MEEWRDRCRLFTVILLAMVITQNAGMFWTRPSNLDARISQCEADLAFVKRDIANIRMDVADLKERSRRTEQRVDEILELLKK